MEYVPYRIWFGEYKGKNLEAVILKPEGYKYFKWVLRKFTQKSLLDKIRSLIEHRFPIQSKCQCGATAEYLRIEGNDTVGFYMDPHDVCCGKCKVEIDLINNRKMNYLPLKLAALDQLNSRTDQERFIDVLKFCCGIKGRLTSQKVFQLFH